MLLVCRRNSLLLPLPLLPPPPLLLPFVVQLGHFLS
jgi:hypothetical protein